MSWKDGSDNKAQVRKNIPIMNNRIPYILLLLFVAVVTFCSCSNSPDNIEPRLQTLPATYVSRTEATLSGKCVKNEGVSMPKFWFSYGKDESMTERLDALTDIYGNVSSRLYSLDAGTTYYYMLRGTNGSASLSGEMISFTTLLAERPKVSKPELLKNQPDSIVVGYTITDDGGAPITYSGCRVSGEGIKGGEKTVVQTGEADDKGMYSLLIDGLQPDVTYTIKAFAVNVNGETESEAIMLNPTSTVVIKEAGTLSTLLGDQIFNLTSLSVMGPLNGDDLRTLRIMAGRDEENRPTAGRLADIDISEARIVSGGGEYGESRFSEDGVIGVGLFRSCTGLKAIKLPKKTVRIEQDAFAGCSSLHSITIPASVSEVSTSAGCTSLEALDVSEANTLFMSKDGVLLSGDGKRILWFPMGKKGEYTLPSTIESVGDYAFRECSVEKFVFPDGLTKLGVCAFYDSKVKEVVLPSTLKQLPSGLFQKCRSLTTVRLGKKVDIINEYVFDGCPIADLYVSAFYPPVCYEATFYTTGNDFMTTCRVHVPKGRKEYYRAKSYWDKFDNIVDDL